MRASVTALAAALCLVSGAGALATQPDRLARLNVEETELSSRQARNMNRLARLLSVLEQLRRDPPPALLVSPQDAKDAVRAAILVRAMAPELRRRAQIYAREAGEMTRQRRLAAVESAALFTRDSLAADALPAPGHPAGGLEEAPPRPPERLIVPAPGAVVRGFGDPLSSGGRANGLTISTPGMARVLAPDAGIVQYVGPVRGWGEIVILRLAGGYHLVLAGLDRSFVTVGQSVAAGKPVGSMPDDRQSLSELYLEVRVGGAPVNPARWLANGTG